MRNLAKANQVGGAADVVFRGGTIITAARSGIIETGELAIKGGVIVGLGTGRDRDYRIGSRTRVIDCEGKFVIPGIVDCHTHLLEPAPLAISEAHGKAAEMAAQSFFIAAMRIGVTSFGEHILGMPGVDTPMASYKRIAASLPIDVRFSSGICCIGTEPLTFLSTATPGKVLKREEVTDSIVARVAKSGQFPGENIFVTATPANLTLDKAPHSGEVMLDETAIRRTVSMFHHQGKKIGAHIEGVESMRNFAAAGGDVIHHAHALDRETAKYLKNSSVRIVATPAAGTSSAPNSPSEIADAYDSGLEISIATDSYIPLHKEATWVGLPPGTWIGPEHLLRIARGSFQALKDNGTDLNEILKIITLNPSKVIGLEKHVGSLEIGKRADLVIADGFPGIDVLDPSGVSMVMKDGSVEIAGF